MGLGPDALIINTSPNPARVRVFPNIQYSTRATVIFLPPYPPNNRRRLPPSSRRRRSPPLAWSRLPLPLLSSASPDTAVLLHRRPAPWAARAGVHHPRSVAVSDHRLLHPICRPPVALSARSSRALPLLVEIPLRPAHGGSSPFSLPHCCLPVKSRRRRGQQVSTALSPVAATVVVLPVLPGGPLRGGVLPPDERPGGLPPRSRRASSGPYLVLNLPRGLSPRSGHLKALIKRIVPFPTFHVVRNELLLEELTMTFEAPTPAPALYSTTPGTQASLEGQAPRAPSIGTPARPPTATPTAPRQHSTTDGGSRPRKGEREGGGPSRGGSTGRGGGQSWPSFYNLWIDIISMWLGQAPIASRPPAQHLLS
jgi:hypothetical protein